MKPKKLSQDQRLILRKSITEIDSHCVSVLFRKGHECKYKYFCSKGFYFVEFSEDKIFGFSKQTMKEYFKLK